MLHSKSLKVVIYLYENKRREVRQIENRETELARWERTANLAYSVMSGMMTQEQQQDLKEKAEIVTEYYPEGTTQLEVNLDVVRFAYPSLDQKRARLMPDEPRSIKQILDNKPGKVQPKPIE